jgi:hypothetical protein
MRGVPEQRDTMAPTVGGSNRLAARDRQRDGSNQKGLGILNPYVHHVTPYGVHTN